MSADPSTSGLPRAWILSVGDELLAGRTLDTNAHFAASWLEGQGFSVQRVMALPDEEAVIADALREAAKQSELVLVGGGLGPTRDDLTRSGLARALGVPLATDAQASAWMEARFAASGRPIGEANRIQCQLPEGSRAVDNPRGTACGMEASLGAARIVVLPGVPFEFRGMVEEALPPILDTLATERSAALEARVSVVGLPESELAERLGELMARGRDPAIGCYPRIASQVLVLRSRAADGSARLARDLALIAERLGGHRLADREASLAEIVIASAAASGTKLAVAESLTAGLVADGLVGVSGASKVFLGGIAAYANELKTSLLGVPEAVLKEHGAVSAETAAAMAQGVLRASGADLAVATTGIAGPGGGRPGKPVGTVWFGLATRDGTLHTLLRRIPGERHAIRHRSAAVALDLLRRQLLGLPPTEPRPHAPSQPDAVRAPSDGYGDGDPS